MKTNENSLYRILSAVGAVLVPFFLIIFAVRLMINPLFARIEYARPNFPQDEYGFNREERLEYSRYAILYLVNNADIDYLADLTFTDGSPLFNQRELDHMVDVKVLITWLLNIWYGVTFVLGGLLILFRRTLRWAQFRRAMGTGGIITIAVLSFVGLLVAINFQWFFTQFHFLFFEGDTWLFYSSDTLIRLFPMQFWLDAAIGVILITLIGAGLLIWQGQRVKTNSPQA
jgi:integral membrane protein (TIGR01906 family)